MSEAERARAERMETRFRQDKHREMERLLRAMGLITDVNRPWTDSISVMFRPPLPTNVKIHVYYNVVADTWTIRSDVADDMRSNLTEEEVIHAAGVFMQHFTN